MQTIIVTGANSGIGKEATRILAEQGHRVLMLCRGSEKSRTAHGEMVAATGNREIHLIPVDLADRRAIRAAVHRIRADFPQIHVLINNAGIYKPRRTESDDNLEVTFAVNYLAPYMLSQLLLENLAASGAGRVVNVVSALYTNGTIELDDPMLTSGYKAGRAYANAKLACVLYTLELARRTADLGIAANALHPGVLSTDVFRDYPAALIWLLKRFLEDPRRGGERIARLATGEDMAGVTGVYLYKDAIKTPEIPPQELAKRESLWQLSAGLTGVDFAPPA